MLEVFQSLGGVTGVVAVFAWLGSLNLKVKRHNRLAQEEYEDLTTWARDDLQQEAAALDVVRADLAARGMLRSGEYGFQLRRVRDGFAQRWRDRKKAGERRLAEMREGEGPPVQLWRKIWRKPWPTNPNADEVRAISAAWEDEQVRLDAVAGEVQAAIGLGV